MTNGTKTETAGRELRWLADSYEQAQRVRIETGERIRAVLHGRDETWDPIGEIRAETRKTATDREVEVYVWDDGEMIYEAAALLVAIAKGTTTGPVPILGRTYARHYAEEREMRAEMDRSLRSHPAWDWLSKVRGIGPTLGAKMLARFDATKAEHASSFWAYAGLATVPGEKWRCPTCGLARSWPAGFNVTGKHQALGTTKTCPDALVKIAGPDDGVRAAQPKPARGQKATYDQYAKKVMYLVGGAFLKAGGPYEEHYRKHRARLEVERPGWADGRKHLTALRIVEKLFLSHLWQIWREALGLPVGEPYAASELGHEGMIDPWSMVEEK